MSALSQPISAKPEAGTVLRASPGPDARQAHGRTLPQLLRDRVREGGEQVCMRKKYHGVWQTLTWNEFDERVRACAMGLARLGVADGDVIGIISENRPEVFWLEHAALAIGARVACAYPDIAGEEAQYLFDHCRARLVLAEDQEQVDKLLEVGDQLPALEHILYIEDRGLWDYEASRLLPFDRLLEDGREAGAADPGAYDRMVEARDLDDVAVVCYTSGTTGRPKGAMLSHQFMLDNAYRVMVGLDVRPDAEYLSYISPAWAAEQFMGVAMGLLAPMIVNFAEKPETVQSDLREIGPEHLLFTPRQWEMMASTVQARMMDADPLRRALYHWARNVGARGDGGRALNRWLLRPLAELLVLRGVRDVLGLSRTRAVLSGGSGLSAELFNLFHAIGVSLRNLYGSTELGLLSSHWEGRFDPDTMGELLPGDPSLSEPTEVWVSGEGELIVRGCAFSGYLHDQAATTEMQAGEGAYHTGDAVRLNGRGQLVFLDRLKDLRTLKDGQRYPPQFIENHLRASPFVKDAMVLGDETRSFVTALINVDAEIAGRFAENNGLAFGTFQDLSQMPEVREQVSGAIAHVNGLLDRGARVRRFATLPKELDPDDGELTRSRKLRRPQIVERYGKIIETMYTDAQSCVTRIRVNYRDGRRMEIDAEVPINMVEATE